MCYGDIHYGKDGYYEQWARKQDQKATEQEEAERKMMEAYECSDCGAFVKEDCCCPEDDLLDELPF